MKNLTLLVLIVSLIVPNSMVWGQTSATGAGPDANTITRAARKAQGASGAGPGATDITRAGSGGGTNTTDDTQQGQTTAPATPPTTQAQGQGQDQSDQQEGEGTQGDDDDANPAPLTQTLQIDCKGTDVNTLQSAYLTKNGGTLTADLDVPGARIWRLDNLQKDIESIGKNPNQSSAVPVECLEKLYVSAIYEDADYWNLRKAQANCPDHPSTTLAAGEGPEGCSWIQENLEFLAPRLHNFGAHLESILDDSEKRETNGDSTASKATQCTGDCTTPDVNKVTTDANAIADKACCEVFRRRDNSWPLADLTDQQCNELRHGKKDASIALECAKKALRGLFDGIKTQITSITDVFTLGFWSGLKDLVVEAVHNPLDALKQVYIAFFKSLGFDAEYYQCLDDSQKPAMACNIVSNVVTQVATMAYGWPKLFKLLKGATGALSADEFASLRNLVKDGPGIKGKVSRVLKVTARVATTTLKFLNKMRAYAKNLKLRAKNFVVSHIPHRIKILASKIKTPVDQWRENRSIKRLARDIDRLEKRKPKTLAKAQEVKDQIAAMKQELQAQRDAALAAAAGRDLQQEIRKLEDESNSARTAMNKQKSPGNVAKYRKAHNKLIAKQNKLKAMETESVEGAPGVEPKKPAHVADVKPSTISSAIWPEAYGNLQLKIRGLEERVSKVTDLAKTNPTAANKATLNRLRKELSEDQAELRAMDVERAQAANANQAQPAADTSANVKASKKTTTNSAKVKKGKARGAKAADGTSATGEVTRSEVKAASTAVTQQKIDLIKLLREMKDQIKKHPGEDAWAGKAELDADIEAKTESLAQAKANYSQVKAKHSAQRASAAGPKVPMAVRLKKAAPFGVLNKTGGAIDEDRKRLQGAQRDADQIAHPESGSTSGGATSGGAAPNASGQPVSGVQPVAPPQPVGVPNDASTQGLAP